MERNALKWESKIGGRNQVAIWGVIYTLKKTIKG